jgi:hypothetical protein
MRCRGLARTSGANPPTALASWSAGAVGKPRALSVLPPVQDTRETSGFPVISPSQVFRFPGFPALEVSSEWYPFSLVEKFYCLQGTERKRFDD